jgi:hypothetical protein
MRVFLALLCALLPVGGSVQADMKPATKLAIGQTTHFTLDKNEDMDFAVALAKGSYYIVCDLARTDGKTDTIIGKVQLLKSNGSMVKDGLLRIAEMGPVVRVGGKFSVAKAYAARLRVLNTDEMADVWMTVIPAAKMKFIPFGFANGELKPLGIGATEGKGGQLGKNEYAFHSIKLKPGRYNVSLYMKQLDGKSDTLFGALERLDSNGFRVPLWKVDVTVIAKEGRQEKLLVLTKEQTVIFRVLDTDNPAEYTVGIEKAGG